MSVALAVFVVVGFALIVHRLGLPQRAREALDRGATCLQTVRDASLDDEAKEQILQGESLRLMGLVVLLVAGTSSAILVPLLFVWVIERVGVGSLDSVLSVLQRADFLAATFVVGALAYLVARRRREA